MHFAPALAALEVLQISVAAFALTLVGRRNAILTEAARTDDLTGLRNRRGLTAAMADLTRRHRSMPAVLLLDLRRFKYVNDHYGYHAGDELLRQVAARIAAIGARHGGVAARLGGDEFALLLAAATAEEVTGTVKEIEQALASPMSLGDGEGRVTVNAVFGASLPSPALPDRPLRAADIALHYARHHGLPSVIYRSGMTYPAAEDRHGPRLRDLPYPGTVLGIDTDQLHWLTVVAGSGSAAGPGTRLKELVQTLDPAASSFGVLAAELVAECVAHGVLELAPPMTEIRLEATTGGQHLDGGFLLLVTFDHNVTLSAARRPAHAGEHPDVDPAHMLLGVVVDTVAELADAYRCLTSQAQAPGR
jgi:diguanylate cyclase (GGDEF)-like protein